MMSPSLFFSTTAFKNMKTRRLKAMTKGIRLKIS